MDDDNLFRAQFDPYQALIDLDARLTTLQKAHNMMARDYEQQKRDFDVLLNSHQHLQKAHLSLSQLVTAVLTNNKEST